MYLKCIIYSAALALTTLYFIGILMVQGQQNVIPEKYRGNPYLFQIYNKNVASNPFYKEGRLK